MHKPSTTCAWIIGLLSVILGACKSTQGSQVSHDEGRFLNDRSAFQWQMVAENEFVTKALAPRVPNVKGLPVDHPLRQRLQFWIDALDRFLREKDPQGTINIPKPQIFVLDNAAPNAFVASVETCLNRRAQLQGAEGSNDDFLGIDRELGAIFSLAGPRLCTKIPYQGVELQRYIDWYLKPFPNCAAKLTASSLQFSQDCLSSTIYAAKSPVQTNEIFVRSTGNWIVVTTGLIKDLTEFEAVYTIFHEAGHYYMAHLSNPSSLYNFFYRLGDSNPNGKPLPDASLVELGKELVYWLKAKETGLRKIADGAPGQKYQSGLYVVARNAIGDWIQKEGTRTACKDLSQFFTNTPSLAKFPLDALDRRGQQDYLLYEKKLDSCLSNLPLDAAAQSRMLGFMRFIAPWSSKVLVDVPNFNQVLPLWNWLNQKIPELIAAPASKVVEVSKKADEVGLGQYTSEQEADQLAVEWLVRFGIDPKNGITGALKLLEIESKFPALPTTVGAYTFEQCKAAYANDFKAADGRDLRVPVGDYSDPHHSSCYRAFDMFREIKTHGYSPSPLRVVPPAPSWEVLAQSITAKP